MVAILILNWNGWEDTIDCLKSILSMTYDDYFVILGDNGSSNESKEKISDFCKSIGNKSEWITFNSEQNSSIRKKEIVLYDLKMNNGFAKGNNLMMQYAWKQSPDYYLLLNNDTVVNPDFLQKLVDFQVQNATIKILTPLIHYFYDKNRIWNAGGKIIWGVRKYFYPDCLIKDLELPNYLACSFITGCALLCTPDVLSTEHTLLSEAFFYGEEDFELGLRMKRKGVKMGCYTPSVIYHKVGRSSSSAGHKLGLIYCHYLNRFVNLRQNLNCISFYTFLIIYAPYVIRLLHNKGISYTKASKFYFDVVLESHRMDGVSYEKFKECLAKNFI